MDARSGALSLWWALPLIWTLGFLAFWPALEGPWLLDDAKLQEMLRQAHEAGFSALAAGGWREHLLLGTGGTGRPLAMASFFLNGLFAQGPFAFKLTNLLLHLGTASVVFLLLRALLRGIGRGAGDGAALVAALIWTLHPLQVSTVAYVVQRMTILSAFFSLSALLLYVRIRMAENRAGVPARLWRWVTPLGVLPVLAVLAKESGALTPAFLLLAELVLFRFTGPRRTRRVLVVYFGAVGVLGALVAAAVLVGSDYLAVHYQQRPFTLSERLLTEPRIILRYIGQILLPRAGDMIFLYDGVAPSRGLLSPPTTLAAIGVLAALSVLAGVLIPRRPLSAFGLLLFLAGHLMESSVLPLELAFEHRNYLPSLGLFLAVTDLLCAATGALSRFRKPIALLTVAVAFALGLLRALAWSSEERIYATALQGHPPSTRARAELAQRYLDSGRATDAFALLGAGNHLGLSLQALYTTCRGGGRLERSHLNAAQALVGEFIGNYETTGLIRLANQALDRDCAIPRRELVSLLEASSRVSRMQITGRQKLLMYVAHLRHELGEQGPALAALEDAYRTYPPNPMPLLLAAHWELDAGDAQAARTLIRRARQAPLHPRLNLAEPLAELDERLHGSQ